MLHRIAGVAVEDLGAGAPVVLLHGWLRNRYSWRIVAPWLATRSRVIAVDLPGFGESAVEVPSDVQGYAERIEAVLAELGVDRAHVVAHGLGGAVALALAIARPERVDRMVLVSPSWGPNPLVGLRARIWSTSTLGPPLFGIALTRERIRRMLIDRHFHDEAQHVDDALVDSVAGPLGRPGAGRAAWSALRIDLDPGLSDVVDRVRAPVALVWGYNDAVHPLDLGRALEKRLPNAALRLIPNCGHAAHELRPRSFGTWLEQHLGLGLDPRALPDGHPSPGSP